MKMAGGFKSYTFRRLFTRLTAVELKTVWAVFLASDGMNMPRRDGSDGVRSPAGALIHVLCRETTVSDVALRQCGLKLHSSKPHVY